MLIPVDKVRIGDRLRRSARPERVAALADSIGDIGLQHPISVIEKSFTKDDAVNFETGYLLVAGLHRLEAHNLLGLVEIEATVMTLDEVKRQLWEIDENLCRADLTELEQSEHLVKRQQIYEWWKPETKQHVAGAVAKHAAADFAVAPSFVADTAEKTGISERTIRQSARRAKKIDAKVRDRIRDKPEIADSGVELDALADLPSAEKQNMAVSLVEAGQADSIRHAKKLMDPPKPKRAVDAIRASEKRVTKAIAAFRDLSDEERATFFDNIKDECGAVFERTTVGVRLVS